MARTAQTGSRLVVITGGPGSGKSSLAAALAGASFQTMPEAGRGIIRDQVAVGGSALPWADRGAFADLMLSWDLRSYREAQAAPGTKAVFFDRGIPDVIGYLQLSGLPIPDYMRRAAETFRYADRVFVAPPWPEIFTQDAERKQTIEEAEATYRAMTDVYARFGYEMVTLPRLSVAERAAFVLTSCS